MKQCVLGLILVLSICRATQAVEPVQATIEVTKAWTGQPVLIVVTLYSPGPFSGTAAFDLPELSSTAIVRTGSPLVGNETIDDDDWFTQRHELNVYTQLTGEVVIPSFSVRFEGKQTFTSEPEPMQGKTSELRFESQRPPGSGSQDLVMSAETLTIDQSWLPEQPDSATLRAGDVAERRISLQATGTTAMLMTPVAVQTPDNVRVYDSDPEVVDKNDRGDSRSSRLETIKYQFEQPGTYELPAIDYIWWDYKNEELRTESLPGASVKVTGSAPADVPPADMDSDSSSTSRWWLLMLVVVGALLYRPARRICSRLAHWWKLPRSVARRELLTACQANDAAAAYAAVLKWQRFSGSDVRSAGSRDAQLAYRRERDALAACLYGSGTECDSWDGQALHSAFLRISRSRSHRAVGTESPLVALNPTGFSESSS